MSFTERLEAVKAAENDTRCPFARRLDQLEVPDTERVAIRELYKRVSLDELVIALRAEGIPNDRMTVRRHMEGRCTCGTQRPTE